MFDKVKRNIENNMPKCTTWLHTFGKYIFYIGIITAIIIFIGFANIDDDFIIIGLVLAVVIVVSCGVYYLLFEALSEIVSNTYRSAEYTKYQAEILSERLNVSGSDKTAHENIGEDLPEM